MTAVPSTGAAAFLGRYEGLRTRLPGARVAWVEALREGAADAFRKAGFPTRRMEAWRYTDLAAVSGATFGEPLTSVDDSPTLPPAAHPRAVFVDGRFRPDLSALAGSSIAVESVAQALPRLEGRIGALARVDEHPMVALNGMLFEDGLVVDVPEGVNGGVLEILSLAAESERAPAFHPRHLVRLGAGATLTVVESAIGPHAQRYLHNPVFEIEVGEGASLTHGRMLSRKRNDGNFHLSTIYARIAAERHLRQLHASPPARSLTRNEIHVGPGWPEAPPAHMNGAQMAADGQHVDTTTALDHAAPELRQSPDLQDGAGRPVARRLPRASIHVHQRRPEAPMATR